MVSVPEPVSSIRVDAPESYVTRLDNDEPNVFWHTPARTKFSVDKLMDQPLTVKRIPIDEVETLMDWEEHCILQRHGGDTDNAWRRSLMIAGGVEEAAERAIWNEPAHHMLQPARQAAPPKVRMLLHRDIEHVISEGHIPDTKHPEEEHHVAEVRTARGEGDGWSATHAWPAR